MAEPAHDRTAAAVPRCPRCGASLVAAPRFCTACGAPIEIAWEDVAPVREHAARLDGNGHEVDAGGEPRLPDTARRSRHRRMIVWMLVLAVLAALAATAYVRYTSTTCQLRRAFGVAGWTCGHL